MNFKKQLFALALSFLVIGAFAQNSAVTKADTYQKAGKLLEAKEQIDLAVVHDKTSVKPKTWYTKGVVYKAIATSEDAAIQSISADAVEQSVAAFKKAKSLEKENGTYMLFSDQQVDGLWSDVLNKGIANYQEEEYEEALNNFAKAKLVKPMDTTAYLYAGVVAQKSEAYDKVLTNYKKLIELGYNKVDIVQTIVYVERSVNKDPQAALDYLRIAREKFPDNADLKKEEINLLLVTDQIDEAKGKLTKAIEAEPDNANLYYNLAFIHDQTDNRDGAIEAYKMAIEVDPEYFDATFNVAVLYYNAAADILKEANNMDLKTYQKSGKALEAKARVEFEKSLPYLERANELKGDDRTVMETLQTVYTQLKMNDKANGIYNQMSELGFYD